MACYVVDSFGNLYSEDIDYFVSKYQKLMPGIEVGIHAHNNQQLAFANTIEAIIKGFTFVDGSIYGMGRAGGNCTTELILGFLENPKYRLAPVLGLAEKYFIDLQRELKWGYELPYMLTGAHNKHPRTALAFVKEHLGGQTGKSVVDFYHELLDADSAD